MAVRNLGDGAVGARQLRPRGGRQAHIPALPRREARQPTGRRGGSPAQAPGRGGGAGGRGRPRRGPGGRGDRSGGSACGGRAGGGGAGCGSGTGSGRTRGGRPGLGSLCGRRAGLRQGGSGDHQAGQGKQERAACFVHGQRVTRRGAPVEPRMRAARLRADGSAPGTPGSASRSGGWPCARRRSPPRRARTAGRARPRRWRPASPGGRTACRSG